MTSKERKQRSRERRKVRLTAPSLVALVADAGVADAALTPFQQAVRHQRNSILEDLGGPDTLATTKLLQVDSLMEAWVVKETMARDVLALAEQGQLWSLRTRRAHPLLLDWLRVKDHYDRLLALVGLERVPAPAKTLEQVLRDIEDEKAAKAVLDGVHHSIESPTAGSNRRGAAETTETPAQPEIAPARPASLDDVPDF